MKYVVTPAEKSTVKIEITFSAEEWAAANDKAYLQNRKKYAVNGFRKGKVPKHVLELYYGKGLFYEDALNLLFSENYGGILDKEEKNFTVVGDPPSPSATTSRRRTSCLWPPCPSSPT